MSNKDKTDDQVSNDKLREEAFANKEAASKNRASKSKISNDEKLSKMLSNRANKDLDFYSKQQQKDKRVAEKLEQSDAEMLNRANKDQAKRESIDSKTKQNIKVAHNKTTSTVIRAKTSGIGKRFNGKPRPMAIMPKRQQNKLQNITTGKTDFASFVATESFASPHSVGLVYENSDKVNHNYSVKVATSTKEIMDEANAIGKEISKREAKVKAEAKHADYRKKAIAIAKKTKKGNSQVLAVDEHNFRIEITPNSEIEYDISLSNNNILINYVPTFKYTVYRKIEDGNMKFKKIVEETNDPSQFNDDPSFEVRENFLYTVYEKVEGEEGNGKIIDRSNNVDDYVDNPKYTVRQNSKGYFFGDMTKTMRQDAMRTAQDFVQNQLDTYIQRIEDNKPRIEELNVLNKKSNAAIKKNTIINFPDYDMWQGKVDIVLRDGEKLFKEQEALPKIAQIDANVRKLNKQLKDKDLNKEMKLPIFKAIQKNKDDRKRSTEINQSLLKLRKKVLGEELYVSGVIKTVFNDTIDSHRKNTKLNDLLWFKKHVSFTEDPKIKKKLIELKNKYGLSNSKEVEAQIKVLTDKYKDKYNNLSQYNNYLKIIQTKFNKDSNGFITLQKLRNDKELNAFYGKITDEDIAKYQQSQTHIDDFKRSNDLEERKAKGIKVDPPLFSSKELNTKEYIATRLLIEKMNLTNHKKNESGYISQIVRKFTINNEKSEIGLNGDRANLPSTNRKSIDQQRTMTYTVFTFPTFLGSSFEFITPEDMVKAAKFRMAKLYPDYDILNMQLHVDEHHSHIHIQNSNMSRKTGFYDFGRTKVDLVNNYNVDNFVKRQAYEETLIQDLKLTFEIFETRKNELEEKGENIELEDVLNHIWIAIDDFVEEYEIAGFNYSTVRPALEILIEKYAEGLKGSKDFSQGYDLITGQILHLWNEKPRIFNYGSMKYAEKRMFGIDFENMNYHAMTKEFFNTPEMKGKYPDLVFTNLDETDYKRHKQREFYNNTKGIDNSFEFKGQKFAPVISEEEALDKKKVRDRSNESKLITGRNIQQLAQETEFKMYATEQERAKLQEQKADEAKELVALQKQTTRSKKALKDLAEKTRRMKNQLKTVSGEYEEKAESSPLVKDVQLDTTILIIESLIGNKDYDFELDEIKEKVDIFWKFPEEQKNQIEIAFKSLALRKDKDSEGELTNSNKLFKAIITEWYSRQNKLVPDNLYYSLKNTEAFDLLSSSSDITSPNKTFADEYCFMAIANKFGGTEEILSHFDNEILQEIVEEYGIDLEEFTAKETLSLIEDFKYRPDTDQLISEYENKKNNRRYKPKLSYTPNM